MEWLGPDATGAYEEKPPRELWIKDEFFSFVESGKKTCELRIEYPGFKRLRTGEILEFKSPKHDEGIKVRITGLRKYPTFEAMIALEDIWKIAPHVRSIAEAETVFKTVFPFHESEVRKNGIVAIQFEKI